jgi:hypothetical protein
VEARGVVDRGDFLEAHALVREGADPFGAVDLAGRQRLVDLAAGDVLHRRAEHAQHLAALARHTEAQALQVFGRVDLGVEPAARLHRGVAAQEGLEVEQATPVLVQLHAALVVVPRQQFRPVMPKGTAVKKAKPGCWLRK